MIHTRLSDKFKNTQKLIYMMFVASVVNRVFGMPSVSIFGFKIQDADSRMIDGGIGVIAAYFFFLAIATLVSDYHSTLVQDSEGISEIGSSHEISFSADDEPKTVIEAHYSGIIRSALFRFAIEAILPIVIAFGVAIFSIRNMLFLMQQFFSWGNANV